MNKFGTDRRRKDGKYPRCLKCVSEAEKKRRMMDPEGSRRKAKERQARCRNGRSWSSHLWNNIVLLGKDHEGSNRTRHGRAVEIDSTTILELFNSQGGRCYISGIPLNVDDKRSSNFPSLDRIDSSKDYVPGNVALSARWVNLGKNRWSVEEMRRNMDLVRSHGTTIAGWV